MSIHDQYIGQVSRPTYSPTHVSAEGYLRLFSGELGCSKVIACSCGTLHACNEVDVDRVVISTEVGILSKIVLSSNRDSSIGWRLL